MTWKAHFSKGMKSLREGDLEPAVELFSKALEADPENLCLVYDARSSALEKLGRHKEALKDVRKTIELAPDQWQGYFRAARLFFQTRQYSKAVATVDMAIDRCPPVNTNKRAEMMSLKSSIASAHSEYIKRTQNHSAILPNELFAEIVHILLDNDTAAALQLSGVCTYWNAVITTNPLFWRTLILGQTRPRQKAELWVSRSQRNISDLHIRAEALDKGWSGQGLEDLNWSHLRNCSISGWDLRLYLKQTNKIHTLTSLDRYEYISTVKLKQDHILFDSSWPIRHLTLRGAHLSSHFNELPPQAMQTLVLQNSTDTSPLTLENYTSLETLVLDTEPRPILSYPTNLAELQRLEINRVTPFSRRLLDISMPNLRALHLRNCPTNLTGALQALVAQGTTRLTELALSGVSVLGYKDILSLLQANPCIEELELSKLSSGVLDIVKSLICGESGSENTTQETICPQLQIINFSHCHDLRTPPLAKLVTSRNTSTSTTPPCARIRTLVVDGCEQIELSSLPWFRTQVTHFSCIRSRNNGPRRSRR